MIRQHPVRIVLGAIYSFAGLCAGQAQAAAPRPQFEAASVAVPTGNRCTLHPEQHDGPAQAIPVQVDEDGVARFYALRPTTPGDVEKLSLECTDRNGNGNTYSVDLTSGETFAPRPFDPTRTTLKQRPALSGDPMSYSEEDLVSRGYGIRPDPKTNPNGYAQWLATATIPMSIARATVGAGPAPRAPSAAPTADPIDAGVFDQPYYYWTGPVLQGSFKQNSNPALTQSYGWIQATWNVPTVKPFALSADPTSMTIWNGLDNVFQTIVDVNATSSIASYGIHRQNFLSAEPSLDEMGVDFVPSAGDEIFGQVWYCDAHGRLNLHGGYGCTLMIDLTQQILWGCNTPDSTDCASYKMKSKYLANGQLGKQAEFIIENDSGQVGLGSSDNEWPDFSEVTMTGSAEVVKGNSTIVATVTPTTDPSVLLYTDGTASTPFQRGDGHLLITLPKDSVKWQDVQTNVYFYGGWSGTNFNSYSEACATSIGVGPDSRGLTQGTPWITGCGARDDGNYNVYQMQTGGAWVKMQEDVANRLAVSPEGNAWALNNNGEILYWNGSKFVENAAGGCATSIGVGPNSRGLTHGTPWTTGCSADAAGNHSVYQMQTDGKWVRLEENVAMQVAVSPEGNAWAIAANGDILYWNGSKFVPNAAGGCAVSIAVGPSTSALPNGSPSILGCSYDSSSNHTAYTLIDATSWKKLQGGVGYEIAASPAGTLWAVSTPYP
jgi:hypothetical protein